MTNTKFVIGGLYDYVITSHNKDNNFEFLSIPIKIKNRKNKNYILFYDIVSAFNIVCSNNDDPFLIEEMEEVYIKIQ